MSPSKSCQRQPRPFRREGAEGPHCLARADPGAHSYTQHTDTRTHRHTRSSHNAHKFRHEHILTYTHSHTHHHAHTRSHTITYCHTHTYPFIHHHSHYRSHTNLYTHTLTHTHLQTHVRRHTHTHTITLHSHRDVASSQLPLLSQAHPQTSEVASPVKGPAGSLRLAPSLLLGHPHHPGAHAGPRVPQAKSPAPSPMSPADSPPLKPSQPAWHGHLPECTPGVRHLLPWGVSRFRALRMGRTQPLPAPWIRCGRRQSGLCLVIPSTCQLGSTGCRQRGPREEMAGAGATGGPAWAPPLAWLNQLIIILMS